MQDLLHVRPALLPSLDIRFNLPPVTCPCVCSWSSLTRVVLHDAKLTCPLDCTDPVALDELVRALYAVQVSSRHQGMKVLIGCCCGRADMGAVCAPGVQQGEVIAERVGGSRSWLGGL